MRNPSVIARKSPRPNLLRRERLLRNTGLVARKTDGSQTPPLRWNGCGGCFDTGLRWIPTRLTTNGRGVVARKRPIRNRPLRRRRRGADGGAGG